MNDENSESKYRRHVARRLAKNSMEVSDRWLARLEHVVDEDTSDIFPTETYLDHIPVLIEEVAKVLENADESLALSNSMIERKAMELGELRHQQKATVNQLLREYDILSKILEEFITEETNNYTGEFKQVHGILLMASVSRIVRSILQSTVDSFVDKYMSTIKDQTEKLVAFNKFVSHELKTPLQAASLNLELLLEGRDPTDSGVIDLIRVQGSIQQAVSMLLNIETITSGTSTDTLLNDTPVQQEVDLAALIKDIGTQLNDTLSDRNVEVIVENDLGRLYAETAKIKLVFTNLLSNAIKYSDPKKTSRWVKISKQDATEGKCRLVLEDNGLGIQPEMRDEVFKMRVRAHETLDAKHDVTGYGLGLYLVAEAIDDIGGSISLDSTVGEGTQVTIEFDDDQK